MAVDALAMSWKALWGIRVPSVGHTPVSYAEGSSGSMPDDPSPRPVGRRAGGSSTC